MSAQERFIALDTETTGLSAAGGDRIVEIGAVEMAGGLPTGRRYHVYLNPYPRKVHEEALRVHGLTDEFLSDKPKFRHEVRNFLEFVGDTRLVIHNAPFDMAFINAELEKAGHKALANEVVDSLRVARDIYPGQRVSLDALCSRLGVDNSGRDLHGALIDADLLAQVYVKMKGLDRLDLGASASAVNEQDAPPRRQGPFRRPRPARPPVLPSAEEAAAHAAFISAHVKDSIWQEAA